MLSRFFPSPLSCLSVSWSDACLVSWFILFFLPFFSTSPETMQFLVVHSLFGMPTLPVLALLTLASFTRCHSRKADGINGHEASGQEAPKRAKLNGGFIFSLSIRPFWKANHCFYHQKMLNGLESDQEINRIEETCSQPSITSRLIMNV